jgi:hypothetical protein
MKTKTLVELNEEENAFWIDVYSMCDDRLSIKKAEKFAWKKMQRKFPRLKKYTGIK